MATRFTPPPATTYDEMLDATGAPRNGYESLYELFSSLNIEQLQKFKELVHSAMNKIGITFNAYSEILENEQIIPFDLVPRLIAAQEWQWIERGLRQRIKALNLFLQDCYSNQEIVQEGIIPADCILQSKGYLPACRGVLPPNQVWVHLAGIDVIKDNTGKIFVLEDNVRCPSGVSYMLTNREMSKQLFPGQLWRSDVASVSNYPAKLLEVLRFGVDPSQDTTVLLTPGVYNSAYFEHSYLALQMGIELVESQDLFVEDNFVWMRTTHGKRKVSVIYRRIDDVFLDRTIFRPDSLLSIDGIFGVIKKGNVTMANALGTGVADDKVIYSFVPKMIEYYLNEEPLLPNVETYLCREPEQLDFVRKNIRTLVVKQANESGGKGILIGDNATEKQVNAFLELLSQNPDNYIAQPIVSLSTAPCLLEDAFESRHIDLRPFVLYGRDIHVVPGGLTRVALTKNSLIVNSSQGGGSKDTWVLTK